MNSTHRCIEVTLLEPCFEGIAGFGDFVVVVCYLFRVFVGSVRLKNLEIKVLVSASQWFGSLASVQLQAASFSYSVSIQLNVTWRHGLCTD